MRISRRRILPLQGGFTLVEVLVATAVLGLVALPLMGLYTASLRTAHSARLQVQAAYHAQHVMETYLASGSRVSQLAGAPINIDGRFSYTLGVDASVGELRLVEVTVTIHWLDGKIPRALKVVRFLDP